MASTFDRRRRRPPTSWQPPPYRPEGSDDDLDRYDFSGLEEPAEEEDDLGSRYDFSGLEEPPPAPDDRYVYEGLDQTEPDPQEVAFRKWYSDWATRYHMNPDPDDPRQHFDYRAAFKAGVTPPNTAAGEHWPSDSKDEGHPDIIVGGFHTKTGARVPDRPQASEADLVRLGWDPQTAARLTRENPPVEPQSTPGRPPPTRAPDDDLSRYDFSGLDPAQTPDLARYDFAGLEPSIRPTPSHGAAAPPPAEALDRLRQLGLDRPGRTTPSGLPEPTPPRRAPVLPPGIDDALAAGGGMVGPLEPPTAARRMGMPRAPMVTDPSTWGQRTDGTPKGNGFLGVIERPGGGVSSEISITVGFDGKDVLIPTMVPTLTQEEVQQLLTLRNDEAVPPTIVKKAAEFAKRRRAAGLPLFALPGEERLDVAPDLPRATVQDSSKPTPTPKPATPATEPSSWARRLVGDPAADIAQGVIDLPGAAAGLADLGLSYLLPTPELKKLAGLEPGVVGRTLEGFGYKPSAWKEQVPLSPEAQAQQREVSETFKTQGFLAGINALIHNPEVAVHSAIQSVPAMFAGGGIGRAVSLAPELAWLAGGIGEGAMQAGSAAEQARQGSKTGQITEGQQLAAVTSGILDTVIGASSGKVAKRFGIDVTDIDALVAGAVTKKTVRQALIREVLGGMFQEGLLEELPQSIQETVFDNLAEGRPIWTGVSESAVMGLVTGSLMSTAGIGYERGKEAAKEAAQRVAGREPTAYPPPKTDAEQAAQEALRRQRVEEEAARQGVPPPPRPPEATPPPPAPGPKPPPPPTPSDTGSHGPPPPPPLSVDPRRIATARQLGLAAQQQNPTGRLTIPDGLSPQEREAWAAGWQEGAQRGVPGPEPPPESLPPEEPPPSPRPGPEPPLPPSPGPGPQGPPPPPPGGPPAPSGTTATPTPNPGETLGEFQRRTGLRFSEAARLFDAARAAGPSTELPPAAPPAEAPVAPLPPGPPPPAPAAAETTATPTSAVSAFDPSVVAKASEVPYKSREKLIELPIADFLKVAKPGLEADKAAGVEAVLARGETFNELPSLQYELRNGQAVVTGHEGRHRARELQRQGYTTMPVVLRGDIRWSEQQDPSAFDYQAEWPTQLQSQKGGPPSTIAFPVSREQAAEKYQQEAARAAEVGEQAKRDQPEHPGTPPVGETPEAGRGGVAGERPAAPVEGRPATQEEAEVAPPRVWVVNAATGVATVATDPDVTPGRKDVIVQQWPSGVRTILRAGDQVTPAERGKLQRGEFTVGPAAAVPQETGSHGEPPVVAARPTATAPTAPETPQPESVAYNADRKSVEIKYAKAPAADVLKTLREAGFKRAGRDKVWYRRTALEPAAAEAEAWAAIGGRPAPVAEQPVAPPATEAPVAKKLTAKELRRLDALTEKELGGGTLSNAERVEVVQLAERHRESGGLAEEEDREAERREAAIVKGGPLSDKENDRLTVLLDKEDARQPLSEAESDELEILTERLRREMGEGEPKDEDVEDDDLDLGDAFTAADKARLDGLMARVAEGEELSAADQHELNTLAERFRQALAARHASMDPAAIIPAPAETISGKQLADGEVLTPEKAAARVQSWKDEAKRIGREEDHSNEVVISLFDHTGGWSQPWVDAGYDVRRFDIKSGKDLVAFFPSREIAAIQDAGKTIVGVLAAPPCTSFAASGARWWETEHDRADIELVEKKYGFFASRYFDTPLDYANTLVHVTQAVIEFANPSQFHALENPVGRIATQTNLPKPLLRFDPSNFGDPYTKYTQLWGDFNPNLPTANVVPTEGSFIHRLRGDVPGQKAQRSRTPEGFAYAFFMANHQPAVAETAAEPETPEDEVTHYRSGVVNSPTDFDGLAQAKVPIGVTVLGITSAITDRVIDYVKRGGEVFVDSGAASAGAAGIDFGAVLNYYEGLADALTKSERGRLVVVAPDVLGDQEATLGLQEDHRVQIKRLIKSGVRVMVPLQKGELYAGPDGLGHYMNATAGIFGDDITFGIPFNKKAYDLDDIVEGLRAYSKKASIHLLGMGGRNRALPGVIEKLRVAAGKKGVEISIDSNPVRSMFAEGRPATEKVRFREEQYARERIDEEPEADTTEIAGAFYRGDTNAFTKTELNQIAKALGVTPKKLRKTMDEENDESERLQEMVDRAGGDQMLDGVLYGIAADRAAAAERRDARRDVIATREGPLAAAFYGGDAAEFSKAELQQLAEALDIPLVSLTSTMGAGGPEAVQELVDENGGDQVVKDTLQAIEQQRGGRIAEEPDAETEEDEAAAGPGARGRPGGVRAEPDGAADGGREQEGGGRPRRGVREANEERAAREADDIAGLVQTAVGEGYPGDPAALTKDLHARLQALQELKAEEDAAGTNGLVLLRAIAAAGGLSIERETSLKGELERLKEYQDRRPPPGPRAKTKLPTRAKGNLAKQPVASGQVRGIKGVYRAKGLTVDEMKRHLEQDPRFNHIGVGDLRGLLAAIEDASRPDTETDEQFYRKSMRSLRAWLADHPWEAGAIVDEMRDTEEGDDNFEPPAAEQYDVLDSGEVQPRLPEAGAVREQETQTPAVAEAPYSLDREVAQGPRATKQEVSLLDQLKADRAARSREPSRARTEEGGIRVSMGEEGEAAQMLAHSLYAASSNIVAPRELLQNAFDAIRDQLPGDVTITFNHLAKTTPWVEVTDSGPGMTRQELETVFTDLFASGKRQQENMAGGFGVAKASFLLGGTRVTVSTVAEVRRGGTAGPREKIRLSFTATPKELLTMKGVTPDKLHAVNVPASTPTGTTIRTEFEDGKELFTAQLHAQRVADESLTLPGTFRILNTSDSGPREIGISTPAKRAAKLADTTATTVTVPGAKVTVYADTRTKASKVVTVSVLNHGVLQFTTALSTADPHIFEIIGPVLDMPANITYDIQATAKEGEGDYPFTANREKLRDEFAKDLRVAVWDQIVKPLRASRTDVLEKTYKGMATVPGVKGAALFDVGKRLESGEAEELFESPAMQDLVDATMQTLDAILTELLGPVRDQIERLGILLDANNHGVFVPDPTHAQKEGDRKATILLNLFEHLRGVVTDKHGRIIGRRPPGSPMDRPDQAAMGLYHTAVHEAIHYWVSGHDEKFTSLLAGMETKLGGWFAIHHIQRLIDAYEDPHNAGHVHPDIESALRLYEATRGRAIREEDALSGTGSHARRPGDVGGEQSEVPGDARPGGEGRVPEDLTAPQYARAAPSQAGTAPPPPARFDLAPARYVDDAPEVSTRVPDGPNAVPSDEILRTDMDAVRSAPGDLIDRFAETVRDYPQITDAERASTKSNAELLETLIGRMQQNLRWLWNRFPDELRERAKQWYVGAHKIARDMAAEFDLDFQQAAAVLAMLSPQMDWFKNVGLAQRTARLHAEFTRNPETKLTSDLLREHQIREYETESENLRKLLATKAQGEVDDALDVEEAVNLRYEDFLAAQAYERAHYENVAWKDLPIEGKAILLRSVDERTDRAYRIVTPEGDQAGWARNKDLKLSKIGWGTFQFLENAISVLEDGSLENIHARLGNEHKVRSFFNNISRPESALSVTIDTHAIAAALLQPFAGSSPPVKAAMSGAASLPVGISGTNALYAEAYFRLADELSKELGQTVLPREVQSVVWEAVRLLFTPEQKKAGSALLDGIDELWADFAAGKISLDALHATIETAARSIGRPAWADAPPRMAYDQGRLRAGDVPGTDAGVSAGRRGDRPDPARLARRGADVVAGRGVQAEGSTLVRSTDQAVAAQRAATLAPEERGLLARRATERSAAQAGRQEQGLGEPQFSRVVPEDTPDPDDVRVVTQVIQSMLARGVTDFPSVVRAFHDAYGEGANELDSAIEAAWQQLRGETVSVAEALEPEEDDADTAASRRQPKPAPGQTQPNLPLPQPPLTPPATPPGPGPVTAGVPLYGVQFPELVALVRDLLKAPPRIVKKFRGQGGTLGMFKGPGGIQLLADLFKPGRELDLAKTLAHEAGHLVDWLPTWSLKRGNLIGRLRTLDNYRKDVFTNPDGTTFKNSTVREELEALSLDWRPWDRKTAPASYAAYRDSARELYADAISVLLNDPGKLERDAPTFHREFFAGLNTKPEVDRAYFELQELLAGTEEELIQKRRGRFRAGMVEGDKKAAALDRERLRQKENEMSKEQIWYRLRIQHIDKNIPLIDRVQAVEKAGGKINPDADPRYMLEERAHLGALLRAFTAEHFQPIYVGLQQAGIGWHTFGEVLFLERVIAGDRQAFGNPGGTSPETAQQQYRDIRSQLTPEQQKVLTASLQSFRAVQRSLLDEAHRVGLFSDEMHDKLKANRAYATFRAVEHLDKHVTFKVYHQHGMLGDISNAAEATMLKMLATVRAIERQKMLVGTFEFLETHYKGDIQQAKEVWQGKGKTPVAPEKTDKLNHIVYYYDKGKLRGKYVDEHVADSLNNTTMGQNLAVVQILRKINTGWFRPVYTGLNLSFQTANVSRDFWRFWKNIPGMTFTRAIQRYWEALPMARVRAFGLSEKPSAAQLQAAADLMEAEKARVLGVTFNDIVGGRPDADNQIEALLERLALQAPKGATGGYLRRIASAVHAFLKNVGTFAETLPKAAGILELRGKGQISDLTPEQRSFIRRKVGSPDFLQGGTGKPIWNEFFLFSNPMTQAVRADAEVATDPKTRAGFWWKVAASAILPKMVQFGALYLLAAGMGAGGGDDDDKEDAAWTLKSWHRAWRGISEYDLTNYLNIPLGRDDKGNTVYIRVPQDETTRYIGAITWKLLNGLAGDRGVRRGVMDILSFTFGQVPGTAPVFNLGKDVAAIASGANVYDPFRQRFLFTQDELLALHAGDTRPMAKFVGYEFQQMGGGIVWKFYPGEQRPRTQTGFQEFLDLPLNLLARWIRVSNYGETERLGRAQADVQSAEAVRRLDERTRINDEIRTAMKLPPPQRSNQVLGAAAAKIAKELYGGLSPKEQQQQARDLFKKIRMGIVRGEADPLTDRVMGAGSNAQKVAILLEGAKLMSPAAFDGWVRRARQLDVLSDDAYKQLIRAQRQVGRPGAAPRPPATEFFEESGGGRADQPAGRFFEEPAAR